MLAEFFDGELAAATAINVDILHGLEDCTLMISRFDGIRVHQAILDEPIFLSFVRGRQPSTQSQLLETCFEALAKMNISWHQVSSVVADEAGMMSNMLKGVEFMTCVAQSFAALFERILALPQMLDLFTSVDTILRFFARHPDLSVGLASWATKAHLPALDVNCSAHCFLDKIKAMCSIRNYAAGIIKLFESREGRELVSSYGLQVTKTVFAQLRAVVPFLQAILDEAAAIDQVNGNIADVEYSTLKMMNNVDELVTADASLKAHLVKCLNLFYQQQSSELSRLALFLSPAARPLLKAGNLPFMHNFACALAAEWKLITSLDEAKSFSAEFTKYQTDQCIYSFDQGNIFILLPRSSLNED